MTAKDQGPFILVSGSNRGIGLHLVYALIDRLPGAIIFAGARDPSSASALNDLASKNTNVHVVKLVVDDEQSNKDAVEEVKKVTERLDIVVANAGISAPFIPIHTEDPKFYKSNYEVNTLGPLYLYQSTYPLLFSTRVTNPSLPPPKLFITSSIAGSIGGVPAPCINGAYGSAKAAANYLAHSIRRQTEQFDAVVIPYNPGMVATDMLFRAAAEMGIPRDKVTGAVPGVIEPDEAGRLYAELIVNSTREKHGGRFWGQGSADPIVW